MSLKWPIWCWVGHKTSTQSMYLSTQTHTHTTILRPFFRDHLVEPVPEENFWTLWCKGRLTEADTQTIRLGSTPSGLTSAHLHHSPTFYRPDAFPAAQPTVSMHWRPGFSVSQHELKCYVSLVSLPGVRFDTVWRWCVQNLPTEIFSLCCAYL